MDTWLSIDQDEGDGFVSFFNLLLLTRTTFCWPCPRQDDQLVPPISVMVLVGMRLLGHHASPFGPERTCPIRHDWWISWSRPVVGCIPLCHGHGRGNKGNTYKDAPIWLHPQPSHIRQLPLTCIKTWTRGAFKEVLVKLSWWWDAFPVLRILITLDPRGRSSAWWRSASLPLPIILLVRTTGLWAAP